MNFVGENNKFKGSGIGMFLQEACHRVPGGRRGRGRECCRPRSERAFNQLSWRFLKCGFTFNGEDDVIELVKHLTELVKPSTSPEVCL